VEDYIENPILADISSRASKVVKVACLYQLLLE